MIPENCVVLNKLPEKRQGPSGGVAGLEASETIFSSRNGSFKFRSQTNSVVPENGLGSYFLNIGHVVV